MMRREGKIFVISGPSGSGKTTLIKNLFRSKKLNKLLTKSISCTTRPRRSGERNGKDYFFVRTPEFKEGLKAKKILEWTEYLGYYYGTPRDFVDAQLKKGRSVILCLDLKGALRIKKLYPGKTSTIFILPPSIKELSQRIKQRCNKTKKEEVNNRVRLARKEVLDSKKFDYRIVNRDLIPASNRLKDIVLEEITKKR
ncbi:guanylate kinase [bacterium]|nr:MAG: guanylate kinase [bacterium]